MGMSKTSLARVISACTWGLPDQVRSILNKYESTLLIPGVDGALRFGFQPGNYRESTSQTLAAADQQVGLVVDAARVPGPELIQVLNFASSSQWDMTNTASFTANTWSMGSSGGPMLVTVPGKTYSVSFPWSATAYGTFALYNGTGIGAPVVAQQSGTSGTLTLIFTAAANRAYFRFSAGGTVAAGAISVRELPGILASQSTSGFQPYLRQSGGVNSWQFDGVDDRLSLSAVPFQTQDVSFAVCAYNPTVSDATFRRLFEFGGNGTEIQLSAVNGGVNYSVKGDTGSQTSLTAGGTSPAGSSRVVSVVNTSLSSRYLRVDGVQHGPVNTFAVSDSTANVATLGNRAAGDRAFSGHKHLQIFGKGTTPPTEAELRTLERWAASLQGRTL